MERAARHLASKIAISLDYGEEQQNVVAYGLFAIFQMILSVIAVFAGGLIVKEPLGAVFICLHGGFLRKYAGGYHAKSEGICLVITIAVCTAGSVAARALSRLPIPAAIPVMGTLIGFSFIVSSLLAPVATANKQIPEHRRPLFKKKAVAFVALTALAAVCGIIVPSFRYIAFAAAFSAAWQTLMLTTLFAYVTGFH